jgi:predicted Fe-S protein YdhL (DUF1289 family)
MGAPSTPCIQLCVVDPVSELCIGCGRTRAEITAWPTLDEPGRLTIMAELEGRLLASRSRAARGGGRLARRRDASA